MILFRPVGLHELALIWDSAMRAFPPRLVHQPIFYPVTNYNYARSIAAEWNAKDEQSGFAGYVTTFSVADSYITNFEKRVVGASGHTEYWIPAEELSAFNRSLQGPITLQAGFFGNSFRGWIPDKFNLKGKNAEDQFVLMSKTWDYSRMDFTLEVFTNQKAVYLNFLFWEQHDFSGRDIPSGQKEIVMDAFRLCWESRRIEIPLPAYTPGDFTPFPL